jgi:hypothetical protein
MKPEVTPAGSEAVSAWPGFTPQQAALLDRLDFYGTNGWDRKPQSEAVMPGLLGEFPRPDWR